MKPSEGEDPRSEEDPSLFHDGPSWFIFGLRIRLVFAFKAKAKELRQGDIFDMRVAKAWTPRGWLADLGMWSVEIL